jgi:hypothetical protein
MHSITKAALVFLTIACSSAFAGERQSVKMGSADCLATAESPGFDSEFSIFDDVSPSKQSCERNCRYWYRHCIENCADPACDQTCRERYRQCLQECEDSGL